MQRDLWQLLDAQQGPVSLCTVLGYCSSGNRLSAKHSSKWLSLSFTICLKSRFAKNWSVDIWAHFWKPCHQRTAYQIFCNSFQSPPPSADIPPPAPAILRLRKPVPMCPVMQTNLSLVIKTIKFLHPWHWVGSRALWSSSQHAFAQHSDCGESCHRCLLLLRVSWRGPGRVTSNPGFGLETCLLNWKPEVCPLASSGQWKVHTVPQSL